MESGDIRIESVDLEDTNEIKLSRVKSPRAKKETQSADFTFIQTFTGLITDQLNEQDINQLLQTQRQMLVAVFLI